jgi:hypothetical protein
VINLDQNTVDTVIGPMLARSMIVHTKPAAAQPAAPDNSGM